MTEYERNELIRFIESIKFDTKDRNLSWIKYAIDMIKEVIIGKIDDIYNEKEMREIDIHRKSYKELQQTVTDLSLENCLLKNKVEEMKWIPCSDRLPDKDGSYLIQNDFGRIKCLDYADGWNCTRDYLSGEIYREYEIHSVVAWMPLPKAYKGEHK